MQGFLVAELQGFTVLTQAAVHRMEYMDLDATRFRGVCEKVFDFYISEASRIAQPIDVATAGGDTWVLAFDSVDAATHHGIELMRLCASAVFDHGLAYLKPSLTLAAGRPKSVDRRIVDDQSIAAYRQADNGYPFEFVVHESAAAELSSLGIAPLVLLEPRTLENKTIPQRLVVDWKSASPGSQAVLPTISSILLDSDAIFSDTAEKALGHLLAQQDKADEILAFGGPVSLEQLSQDRYVRSTIRLLRSSAKRWTLLSYIPANEPMNSLAWLELCRVLQREVPDRFAVAAFPLSANQLRPFSYQIFDDSVVHVGLRQYSPHKGTPTMSGAILLRNRQIAARFRYEFTDSYQTFGRMDENRYNHLISTINATPEDLRMVFRIVDGLLEEKSAPESGPPQLETP
jgi:hypothetical protein